MLIIVFYCYILYSTPKTGIIMQVVTTRDFRADIMSEAELKSIRRGLEDVKAGKVYKMDSSESLDSFIDRMEHV